VIQLTGLPLSNPTTESKGNNMDVKNLKEALVCLALAYQGVVNAKADDGKIDLTDLTHLLPALKAAGPAIADIKLVVPEAKDLSEAEIKELIDAVKAACPALGSDADTFLKVSAILNLLRAGKDAYLAFGGK
jgi:hypothetical protein